MSTENRSLRLPLVTMQQERATKQSLTVRSLPLIPLARVATAVLGGVLVASGLRRRSLVGAAVAVAGGELLRRSLGGNYALGSPFETATWQEGELSQETVQVIRAITIRRPAEELCRLWLDPKTQQRIMEPFAEVTLTDPDHAHWVMRGPLDLLLVWDTELVEDRPGELLRWRSLPRAPIPHEGLLHFRSAPAERGTEVILRLRFPRLVGSRGQTLAKLVRALPSGLELEAQGTSIDYTYDRVKQALHLPTDRGEALRQAILACRKGGVVSILGVYGVMDKFPVGVILNKGLTVRAAQQHGQKYVPRLLEHVERGELDPSFLITHRLSLEEAPHGYHIFKHKEDGCVRVVFVP